MPQRAIPPREKWSYLRLILLVTTTFVVIYTVARIFVSGAESTHSPRFRIGYPLAASVAGVVTVMMFSRIYSLQRLFLAYPFTNPKPFEMGIALLIAFVAGSIQVGYELIFCAGTIRVPHMIGVITFLPRAFFEELLFRGALNDGLRSRFSLGWTFLIIWIVFALLHQRAVYDPLWVVCAMILNFGLCWMREKHNNLWTCIVAHWAYNVSLLFVADLW
jgi:membrane protease YdiL (CAAX protease family)